VRKIDVLEIIKERRSIHTFKKEEVPANILKDIFTYASWAPTHYMKEPWEMKIFEQEGKKKLINAIIKSYQRIGLIKNDEREKTIKTIEYMSQFLDNIPHHALIHFQIDSNKIRYEEDYSAVCAFIQNSQLAAWKFGVGMLWTITPFMHDPHFAHDIDLDAKQQKIAAVMQIGYPKSIPNKKFRTPIRNKLEFIRNE